MKKSIKIMLALPAWLITIGLTFARFFGLIFLAIFFIWFLIIDLIIWIKHAIDTWIWENIWLPILASIQWLVDIYIYIRDLI